DAHAAGAQHLADAISAQPADLSRFLGRRQNALRTWGWSWYLPWPRYLPGDVRGSRVPSLPQLLDPLHQARHDRRHPAWEGGLRGHRLHQRVPFVQGVQAAHAHRTVSYVPGHFLQLSSGQPAQSELSENLEVRASNLLGHGFAR